jgi:hypothetical protein
MLEKLHERVSVLATYSRGKLPVTIHKVKWNGRVYSITQIGYVHKMRVGRNIVHVFHVNNTAIAFKLQFDTENLTWYVLEVSDGA